MPGEAALLVDEVDAAGERLDVGVLPDAQILRADPALGRDGGRLGEDHRGAADGARAQVDEVPVVGEAIDAGVLAHRRDENAIGERDPAQCEGVEQGRHPHSVAADVQRGLSPLQ